MRSALTAALAIGLCALTLPPALAQAGAEPLPLEVVMASMPDHTRYRVEMAAADMDQSQMQNLARMIGEAAQGQHFYGAVFAYRPLGGERTEFKMRSGLHSREAARNGALADCNAARAPEDSECALVGEILPENWSAAMPTLSHVAVEALRKTADALPGKVVVARSASGDGFEIRSGEDVRAATLAACNEANRVADLPEDCAVVIDDLAGTD